MPVARLTQRRARGSLWTKRCKPPGGGVLVRKLRRRGNFASKAHLKQRIEAFIACINQSMAKPFRRTMEGRPLTV